ncbi:MAG: YicC family protein [Candidatus Marisimplicoccus sp.]
MIHSMTGFGREEKLINNKKIVIEIRTLNSKGLDINLKVHDSFSFIGEYLRKSIKEKLIKGKVDVIIDIEDTTEALQIPFNKSKIKSYLKELRKDFKIDESQIISNLLSGNTYVNSNLTFTKSEEKKIKILLDKVIQKQLKYRKIEGKAIGNDLSKSVSKINSYISKTISIESNRVEEKKKKFKSYFNELNEKFDKSRLEQEMIYYIEKLDINEEIIRLKHHLKFFSLEMKNKEIKGKKLSFICQEIGREINTIGSKANNFEIQSLVVNMKEELEKIKENILNIL